MAATAGILNCFFFLLPFVSLNFGRVFSSNYKNGYISAVGDPGMKRDGLRLAIESWNQCNEVGEEAPNMGSPRAADCFDVYKASPQSHGKWIHICTCFFSFRILISRTLFDLFSVKKKKGHV